MNSKRAQQIRRVGQPPCSPVEAQALGLALDLVRTGNKLYGHQMLCLMNGMSHGNMGTSPSLCSTTPAVSRTPRASPVVPPEDGALLHQPPRACRLSAQLANLWTQAGARGPVALEFSPGLGVTTHTSALYAWVDVNINGFMRCAPLRRPCPCSAAPLA